MLEEKDIQAIAQLLGQQKNEIMQAMDARFGEVRQEMDTQFGELRQEMDTRFGVLREEIDTRFGALREEIDTRFAQQKSEIVGELRQEMDARFAQQKSEIVGELRQEIAQQGHDIRHEVGLLMESYFDPKFNALADGLEMLKEKALGREELEETSDRLDVLEAVVKVHSREIEKLKKAQSA